MAIEHVVVLCLENRSFDHMLGYLDHPDPSFTGLRTGGPYENPGADGQPVAAAPGAKRVLPFGPDHSHNAVMAQLGVTGRGTQRRCSNAGFVASYEAKADGRGPGGAGGLIPWLRAHLRPKPPSAPRTTGRGPLIMLCQDPERIPVLATLALQFAVFDRWFCSVPGETWPNRNYLHAATSNGETDIEPRFYTDPTIFELLEAHGSTWHIYHDDTPQVWAFPHLWDTPERHANWYPTTRFADHARAGTLPTYSFIEPNHKPPFHTLDHTPEFGGAPDVSTSQHPENNLVSNSAYDTFDDTGDTDFERGERLVATIYEALRANPELFARTLFLITYDEHGGFYDHVSPPTDVPAPGGGRRWLGQLIYDLQHHRSLPFDFRMLGPRVPAVVVSPLVEAGVVVHDVHEHASLPATLRALFAPTAKPLTKRDAWARPFHKVATRTEPRTDLPDLSAYASPAPAPAAAAAVAAPPASEADAQVPDYYREFVAQADVVLAHLQQVGEPEVAGIGPTDTAERAEEISAAFAEAAHRHRANPVSSKSRPAG